MKSSNKILFISFIILIVLPMLLVIGTHIKKSNENENQTIVMHNNNDNKNLLSATGNTSQYKFSNFTQINIAGSWNVDITHGDNYQVMINASPDLTKKISVQQQGENLILDYNTSNLSNVFSESEVPKATIVLPNLYAVEASGSSIIQFSGFTGKQLILNLSGNSKINSTNNDITNFTIETGGNSYVNAINNKITNLSISSHGNSVFDFNDSSTINADLNLSGANKANFKMAGGTIKGNASGASIVTYSGPIHSQNINTSGFSKVIQK